MAITTGFFYTQKMQNLVGRCEGLCQSVNMERWNGTGDSCMCAVTVPPPKKLDVNLTVEIVDEIKHKTNQFDNLYYYGN